MAVAVAAQPGGAAASTPPAKHPLDKGDFKVGFSAKTKAKQPKKTMPADESKVFHEIADGLPRERAVRCSEEYRRADRAWTKLLAPYVIG